MYTITLEVNQICNLRCDYCYLGEKTNQIMPEEIACKGIEIAFLNVEKHKDKSLWVDFVGGEALISFALLRKLVEHIEEEAAKRTIAVSYSITTNGTIMNNEILEWLAFAGSLHGVNILAARNHEFGNLEIRVLVLGNRLFCA